MPEDVVDQVHEQVHSVNPFNKDGEYGRKSIISHRVATAITYLLVVVTAIYYTFKAPGEGGRHGSHSRHTIWGQNSHNHTPFALNSVIVSIYWLVVFILQIGYSYHLYHKEDVYVKAAANVGAHFVTHNLFLFGFIHLWTRGYFYWAELLLIINFFNLSFAYFRHARLPLFIHIPVVSAPLAWNFVALYWCGAAAVHAHNLPARIVANIFVWGIMVYGGFFLVAYKDWTMGFELSVLAAALGVAQFLTHAIAFQWIFAFIIMGVLFVLSLAVAIPGSLGHEPFKRGQYVSEDQERAPLLQEAQNEP